MNLESIIPMQNSLRNPEQLPEMIEFVRLGGIFTKEVLSLFPKKKLEKTSELLKIDSLIKIVRFEDGSLYVHDGLHRATAIWIAGRTYLDPREFVLENWKYDYYLEININENWFTPFDPRKEVRINDILVYKNMVKEFLGQKDRSIEEIRKYILDHYEAQSYTEPRSVKTIPEMASRHTSAIVVEVD